MSGQSLRTEALSIGYGKKTVAEDISLLAEPGQILCLIGPNGAGKSTLLKTLIRQLPPLSGAVFLGERRLDSFTERELARSCAAVLTGRPAPELMRSEEVVSLGRFPYTGRLGVLSEEDRRVVRESMDMTGVTALSNADFTRLSDGQRQRVLLARAICQQPRLLVMDEPTSFLDIRHKLEFLHLLRELVRQRGLAVVLSMHELDLAQKFSDRLVCMKNGRVDRVGSPAEIFSGDYIQRLFNVTEGSYDSLFGTAEPAGSRDAPRAFVIGGGGSGIPVYRALARRAIPFAAGVLPENDLDLPTARALSARLFTDRADEAVSAARVDEALETLRGCETVYCAKKTFGSVTKENARLLACAEELGLLRELPD